MNINHYKSIVVILSIVVFFVVVGSVAGVFLFRAYNSQKRETQALLDEQNKRLAEEQKQLTASQVKSEADQKALQAKIAQVQADAEKKAAAAAAAVAAVNKSTTNNDNYSTIVAEWQNRLAQVTCYWFLAGIQDGGSATIVNMASPYGLAAVTNAHVIINASGYGPDVCTVANALGSRTITNDSVGTFFMSGTKGTIPHDFAYIEMGSPTKATDNGGFQNVAASHLNVCNVGDVKLGDKILVLGYPWNGSQMGVTATQGLISGFDGDYYVTDAKIDHGNSGGAAILMKNDCWLGIPSAAVVGSIESYGRILGGQFVLSN